jgi:hypothetical protein
VSLGYVDQRKVLLRNCPGKAGRDSQIAEVHQVESSRTPIFVTRLTVIVDLDGSGKSRIR